MKQGYIILALVVVCLFQPTGMCADTIKGRVTDAETGEPLQGAKVVFTEEAVGNDGTTISTVYADSLGRFLYACQMEMSRLTITASHFGYHNETVQRSGNNDRDTITLDDFRLKMDEHLLGEVTVTGHRRRFTMRGDTIVFNPEAFHLQDGARLIELIEQLPGVSIKDGKLLWNGEPLKLMMNGQEAVSDGMLTSLLPVEAVKNVKAYDKRSEFAERMGVADGQEEHVLDVSIKPSFMDKLYGDAEAKAYSQKNYAAHLRAMRLSDTDPLMLYGRVADDPKVISTATIQQSGSWQGDDPVRQQMGAVGYGHFWEPEYKVRNNSNWNVSAGINHTDVAKSNWENRQTFFDKRSGIADYFDKPSVASAERMSGSTGTETDRTSNDYLHNLRVPIDFNSFLNLTPNTMMRLSANVTYHNQRNTEENIGKTFDIDSVLTLTNTSDYQSLHHEEGLSTKVKAELFGFVKKTEYIMYVATSYQDMKRDGESTGIYQYQQRGLSQTDCQRFHAPTHYLMADVGLKARRAFSRHVVLLTSWQTIYDHAYRDEQRHRADTLDLANSLRRKDGSWRNSFYMEANITQGKFSAKPSFDLSHRHERTDYRRGQLDTLAHRNLLLATPTLEMTYKLQKQTHLKSNVAYTSASPDLIDCIGYHDDTNPLYVTLGNPSLRTSHTLRASLAFNTMLTRGGQVVNVSVDYSKDYDPIGTILHYNSFSGAYLAQKQNVRGGHRWGANLLYERDLGGCFHVSNNLSGNYGQSYGIMTLLDDETGIFYNRQRSSDFSDRLNLEHNNGAMHLRLDQNFIWHRYTYSKATQPRQDIYNYRAELSARYELKSWTFQFIPTFFLNRGYLSDALNRNRFLCNASIRYGFLKNKASLILYANDLFNRDTRNFSDVTATTRTEGGSSLLHHYVSLTFNYKFDAKKR